MQCFENIIFATLKLMANVEDNAATYSANATTTEMHDKLQRYSSHFTILQMNCLLRSTNSSFPFIIRKE